MAILSFLGMANIAVRLVNEQYPGSVLYEGDGLSPGGPTINIRHVNSWRFVFRTADGGTAFIHSTVWGEFGPITYIPQLWLGNMAIPWPIPMDIAQADELLKRVGFTGAYGTVTLRWPLYPGSDQPYYIFNMVDGGYLFVGTYDGSITRHSAGA